MSLLRAELMAVFETIHSPLSIPAGTGKPLCRCSLRQGSLARGCHDAGAPARDPENRRAGLVV